VGGRHSGVVWLARHACQGSSARTASGSGVAGGRAAPRVGSRNWAGPRGSGCELPRLTGQQRQHGPCQRCPILAGLGVADGQGTQLVMPPQLQPAVRQACQAGGMRAGCGEGAAAGCTGMHAGMHACEQPVRLSAHTAGEGWQARRRVAGPTRGPPPAQRRGRRADDAARRRVARPQRQQLNLPALRSSSRGRGGGSGLNAAPLQRRTAAAAWARTAAPSPSSPAGACSRPPPGQRARIHHVHRSGD
jgi:hypothetical protein